MHCIHCGNQIPEGVAQCPACNSPVPDWPGAIATTPYTPSGSEGPEGQEAELRELGERLQAALGSNYTVERSIGHGGFAVVYLVRDLTLKRALAVKVLSPDLVLSKTVIERFRREAETIAQLSHAHIVPVHFVGQEEDLFYLAMAFVEGESLADRLAREGKLPVEEATRIFREVASALDLAHRRGVIHRDIKPHNVLLEKDTGRALLTDFGIARTAKGSHLTSTGMVVGTPAYMSPEQVTGDKVDHRSDIYALGVVAYEMLAGAPPFTGTTPEALLYRRVTESPQPIQQVNPDVPPPLAEVINGCVASNPEDRITSTGDIVQALGGTTPVSGTRSIATRALRRRPIPRSVVWAAAVVLVVGVLGTLWMLRRTPAGPTPPVAAPLVVPDGMVLIPGGVYTIGRDDGQAFARPAHAVTIDSLAIERTEVTVGEYARYAAETGAPTPWTTMPDPELPVTRVTWFEARDYCARRYEGGRLPTEQEWEAAARGPAEFRFPWSDTDAPGRPNTQSGRLNRPTQVGYSQNALGLFDLIGNVWEWTGSRLLPYPGGTVLEDGAQFYVIRGGAYNTPDSLAQASYRGFLPPTLDRGNLQSTGFRCAVSVSPGG